MSAIINALTKALAANPDDWESRLGLIQAYLAEGNKNDARAQLNDVESLPSDEAGLILAARCYALCGSEHARGVLQPVLDANPANADAHMAMASIAHGEADTAAAMRHYITATSLDPSQSDPELDPRYGDLEKSAPPPAPSEAAVIPSKPVAVAVEPEVEVDDALEADLAPVAEVEPEPEAAPSPAPSAASERVEFAPRSDSPPAPSTAARPRHEPAAPKLKIKRRAEPSGVFYPEPGQFPTRTLRQAIDDEPAVNLEAEIEEVEAPKLNVEEAKPAPVLHTAEEEAVPEKAVWVAVDREVPAVYDYQKPDETIFEPTVTADDIQVAATHTDDGQLVATPDMDLKAAEEKAQALVKRKRSRDRLNAVVITILAHVGLAILLAVISTAVVTTRPPEIIGTPGHKTPTTDLEVEEIQKQVTRQPSSVAESMPEIISSMAQSNVAISNQEFTMSDATVAFGTTFTPSMDFSASASSGDSTMLFGQKVEGKVLGVILDVSGSMAEYLPQVIREIDKNFKDAPIVFVNNALVRQGGRPSEILPVVGEDVVPSRDGRTTPFWFLWGDLPRKAPQTSVDRLINIMRTRENLFLAVGGHNRVEAGVQFLIEQKIDALYMFSDFEDYVDEELAAQFGQNLSRGKVKAYIQPAEEETEFLNIMDTKMARRSRGKLMPSLVSILRPESDEPKPIMVAQEEGLPELEGVMHAAPRTARAGKLHYEYRPSTYRGRFDELQTIESDKYDLVLCQPEARAYIFLKNDEGAYIQNPVVFSYHSQKTYWNEKYQEYRTRGRRFLRHEEPPGFNGNEFTWKMILEDEIRFEVIFWFKDDVFTGTYAAELPPDGRGDAARIAFHLPRLAHESKDRYYSYDFPGGLSLDNLRLAMHGNTATFKLPAQAEDRMGASWNMLGFKRGDNECPYYEGYRSLPDQVREIVIQGRSFGPRVLTARTTANRLLLNTYTYRADIELWEGYAATLSRPSTNRHRVTKTEAISFTVE